MSGKTVHFTISLLMPTEPSDEQQFMVLDWLKKQIVNWNKKARESIGFDNEEDNSIGGAISNVLISKCIKTSKSFRTEFRPAWQFIGQSSKCMYTSRMGRSAPVPLEFYRELRDNLKEEKPKNLNLKSVYLLRAFSVSHDESLLYLNL